MASKGAASKKQRHSSVLFVCWGNICRSPTAEAVFNKVLDERGIADRWTVDSAGTGEWNIGDAPDPRAQETLRLHGLSSNHIARIVTKEDSEKFDYIVCFDDFNVQEVKRLLPGVSLDKIHLLGKFDRQLKDGIIKDPYYASDKTEFELVYATCQRACRAFLDSVDFDNV